MEISSIIFPYLILFSLVPIDTSFSELVISLAGVRDDSDLMDIELIDPHSWVYKNNITEIKFIQLKFYFLFSYLHLIIR